MNRTEGEKRPYLEPGPNLSNKVYVTKPSIVNKWNLIKKHEDNAAGNVTGMMLGYEFNGKNLAIIPRLRLENQAPL